MDFLNVQREDVIEIPQENRWFLYLALDLLALNKGNVFCKTCAREYQANELASFPVGARESSLKVKVGYRESLQRGFLDDKNGCILLGARGIDVRRGMS
jgi:hypothetical protein